MLDFYFLPDDQSKPNNPDETNFAGSLNDNTYYNLQQKGMIDKRFDYYSDFRWSNLLLKQIRDRIDQKQIHADTDVMKLLLLVDAALKKQVGLMAFGD